MRFISKHDWWGIGPRTMEGLRKAEPGTSPGDHSCGYFDPTAIRDKPLVSYHGFKFICIKPGEELLL